MSVVQAGQSKIATTGTAVPLAVGSVVTGIIITANSTNSGPVYLGSSAVTNTGSGTGNGYVLAAGGSVSVSYENFNASLGVYVNGTAGDWVSWIGS